MSSINLLDVQLALTREIKRFKHNAGQAIHCLNSGLTPSHLVTELVEGTIRIAEYRAMLLDREL